MADRYRNSDPDVKIRNFEVVHIKVRFLSKRS